jgi:hypothetical protein
MFANRYRAGAVYLAASVTVATGVFALIYFVWYPKGLFETAGGVDLFLLIAIVDVVVGPLLVTIIFLPGKAGLTFDLATIAVLQLVALGYGLHVLYLSRPAYVVFVKDRFELVRASEIPDSERQKATLYRDLPILGPQIIGAHVPADPEEVTRIMFASVGGVDGAAEVDRLLARIGRPENEIAFVPFKAGNRELTALIDAKKADLITVAPLRPWN